MKRGKYLTALLIICVSSYFMMCTMCLTADAEDLDSAMDTSSKILKRDSLIYDLRDTYINEQKMSKYISGISKLTHGESSFIVRECKKNDIDPFVVLGVIKKESNFDPHAVGASGERGLGQLMENTAKPVAKNLGYIYDNNKLFDTKYNLKLTITQLSYLHDLYGGDINKTLTAYNRGQQGLNEYMNERKSKYDNPAMSDYSVKVLEFADGYKEEFVNLMK